MSAHAQALQVYRYQYACNTPVHSAPAGSAWAAHEGNVEEDGRERGAERESEYRAWGEPCMRGLKAVDPRFSDATGTQGSAVCTREARERRERTREKLY